MNQITITSNAYSALKNDSERAEAPYLEDSLTIRNEDDTYTVTLDTELYNGLMQAAMDAPGTSLSDIILTICAQTERNRGEGGTEQ